MCNDLGSYHGREGTLERLLQTLSEGRHASLQVMQRVGLFRFGRRGLRVNPPLDNIGFHAIVNMIYGGTFLQIEL